MSIFNKIYSGMIKGKLMVSILVCLVAVSCNHRKGDDYFYKANSEYDNGNLWKSIEYYDKAIKIYENPEFYLNRGNVYLDLEKFYQAQLDFKKAIELGTVNNTIFLAIGLTYYELGDYKSASLYFDKQLKNDKNNLSALLHRGYINMSNDDYFSAKEDFSKALKTDSLNINGLINRACCNINIGEFDLVINDCKRVIAIDSLLPNTYYFLGMALIEKGNNIDGCKSLHKAKDLGYDVEAELDENCN
jgi:tetratricopeptide (TPR) repeat protein